MGHYLSARVARLERTAAVRLEQDEPPRLDSLERLLMDDDARDAVIELHEYARRHHPDPTPETLAADPCVETLAQRVFAHARRLGVEYHPGPDARRREAHAAWGNVGPPWATWYDTDPSLCRTVPNGFSRPFDRECLKMTGSHDIGGPTAPKPSF
jgi:hypothetical protein